MKIIDNKVSKSNSLDNIIKESNRSKSVLKKTNFDIYEKGSCIGYVVVFPASKWSRPKYNKVSQSIKHCNKKVIASQNKNKSKKKVSKESKNTKKCKCSSPSWMVVAKEEMNKKVHSEK